MKLAATLLLISVAAAAVAVSAVEDVTSEEHRSPLRDLKKNKKGNKNNDGGKGFTFTSSWTSASSSISTVPAPGPAGNAGGKVWVENTYDAGPTPSDTYTEPRNSYKEPDRTASASTVPKTSWSSGSGCCSFTGNSGVCSSPVGSWCHTSQARCTGACGGTWVLQQQQVLQTVPFRRMTSPMTLS